MNRPANLESKSQESLVVGTTPAADSSVEVFAFPLSPAQEKMWRADREQPGNPSYNASFRWSLLGPLDPLIIERAFNEIIRRHEALRATFTVLDGKPVQLIAPSVHLKIAVTDLRHLPQELRDAELDRFSAEEARRSFDLEKSPLLRVGLLRMEDQSYVLYLTLHHIICDGWSIGLIMEELQEIYSAFAEGRESPLPELSIQFGDYVVWQQEMLAGENITRQLEYWKKKLAGYRRLDVPGDLQHAPVDSTNSAILSMVLPRELSNVLKELSNQQGGTMFVTSLATCLLLLRQITGKTDLAVGTPLAGRNRTDIEGLIGLFVNHIVVRADASGDPTFAEFAKRVRDSVWEAFAHQDVPFENVLKALNPGPNPYREPFHVINFICQREYARAATFVFEFSGIRMSTMPSKSQGALYDLNFFMVEREDGWRLSLEYKTEVYGSSLAQQMLNHFRRLLDSIAENPNRRLSEFPVWASEEEGPASNSDAVVPPVKENLSAPELYAMPASVAQERFWLLSKLAPNNSAFHMPACVRISGPLSQPLLQKSFQFLVDRHETLRTTFEEIDEHLMQVISPEQAFSLPLTDLQSVPDSAREQRLQECVREEAEQPFHLQQGPVFRARLFRLHPESHVLLVTIHHILADGWSQNILQSELWSAYEAFADNRDAGLPPLAIQYSDFTVWQKEWLASDHARNHLNYWTKQLASPLPVLDFPLDRVPTNRPAAHGAIETALLPEDLMSGLKALSRSENVTMFVLTLACFGILLNRFTDQTDIVVGSPVANRRTETEPLIGPFAGPFALRLDLSGNPTLREVLARVREVTYDALSHTELPFEVLLENLKVRSVDGRNPLFQFYFFYQTAFLQPRQLKQLTVTPMPTFSVGTPFEIQLGFVERSEGLRAQVEYNPNLFDASTIQETIRYYETLLRALIADPTRHIAELPSPAKKVNSGLSRPVSATREHVAPRDNLETTLAQIWQEIFDQPGIGIRDDFFELGGHSLLAAKLLTRIEHSFGKELPLASILDASTIEKQARLIRGEKAESLNPSAARSGQIPLFYLGGDPTFRPLSQKLSALHEFHSLGMQASFVRGLAEPYSLQSIAAHFVRAIRERRPEGPYMLGGWCSHGLLALEVAQQLRAQGQDVALIVMMETPNPVELNKYAKWKRFISRAQIKLNLMEFEFAYLRQISRAQTRDYLLSRLKKKILGAVKTLSSGGHGQMADSSRYKSPVDVLYAAGENYCPSPYTGRVVLFRSRSRSFGFAQDLRLGWGEIFPSGLEICEVPGNHYTFYMEPNVSVLAREIAARLKKVEEDLSPIS